MDMIRGEGWEEQEIGKCAICGGWVVVYHHIAPAAGPLREPWCVTCGAVLSRESALPTTEKTEDGPWMHVRDVYGIEDPQLRRAYQVGLRRGYLEGARTGLIPGPIAALPEEI